MKYSDQEGRTFSRALACLVVIVMAAFSTLTPVAFLQPGPVRSTVTITRPPTQIKPGVIRAVPRPPSASKPLEMVDPRTGKPVAPTAMLTLEDGKTIPAAKYYEQM